MCDMQDIRRMRGVLLALLALLCSLCLTLPSFTRAYTSPMRQTIIHQNSVLERKAVAAYWTSQRMRSARFVTRLPGGSITGSQFTNASLHQQHHSRPIKGDPILPKKRLSANIPVMSSLNEPNQDTTQGPSYHGANFVIGGGAQQVPADPRIGRVFFHDPSDGGDYRCTGVALSSNNKSVVETAAHCVMSHNKLVTNWLFCPAYDGSNPSTPCPAGQWIAMKLNVSPVWQQNTDPNDAFGFVTVYPRLQDGTYLGDLTGMYGWLFNMQTSPQTVDLYGYPGTDGFDGQHLYECSSKILSVITNGSVGQLQAPCNLAEGASGGPWIITMNGIPYLIGDNDTINGAGNMNFSPYYGVNAYRIFNAVQNQFMCLC